MGRLLYQKFFKKILTFTARERFTIMMRSDCLCPQKKVKQDTGFMTIKPLKKYNSIDSRWLEKAEK